MLLSAVVSTKPGLRSVARFLPGPWGSSGHPFSYIIINSESRFVVLLSDVKADKGVVSRRMIFFITCVV